MTLKLDGSAAFALLACLLVACGAGSTSADPDERASNEATEQASSAASTDSATTATVDVPSSRGAAESRLFATAPLMFGDCTASCETDVEVYDDLGNPTLSISFDNEVTFVEVDYPARTVVLVHHSDGAIEPFVVDLHTGRTQSVGRFADGYQEMSVFGQPRPASRWHQTVQFGATPAYYLADLETLDVRVVTDMAPRTLMSFSADEDRLAVVRSDNSIEIVEPPTFEVIAAFEAQPGLVRATFISPDGTKAAAATPGPDATEAMSVSILDERTNERTELNTLGAVLGWFDDQRLVIQTSQPNGDNVTLLDVKTGVVGTPHETVMIPQLRAVPDAPWHITSATPSPELTNVETGITVADESIDAMVGFGQPIPPSDYVWLTTLGINTDGSSRFGVTRVSLRDGNLTSYSPDAFEGKRLSSSRFRYSHDGSALVIATSEGSLYLAADGTVTELPEAVGSSVCDDGSFLLVGRSVTNSLGPASPTALYSTETGAEAIMDLGVRGQAICVG